MSRSGYTEDCEHLGLWRGAVACAINGKRGQALLRDLLAALDAMPEKRLIVEALEHEGEVCALGALGRARGMAMQSIDPGDYDAVADAFGCARALAQEIEYENDEGRLIVYEKRDADGFITDWKAAHRETPEERWQRMRQWVATHIRGGA